MKGFTITGLAAVLTLAACGGDDSASPPPPPSLAPAPTPSPTPTPEPTPTPTPTALTPREEVVAAVASGPALRFGEDDLAVRVTSRRGSSAFTSPEIINYEDERLLFLGGKYALGTVFPYTLGLQGQAITNGNPSVAGPNGLPRWRSSIHGMMRFTLPAGQDQFEWISLASGGRGNLFVYVEGVATNASGYDLSPTDGRTDYRLIELPPSEKARTITLTYSARPVMGLHLPDGETLDAAPEMTNAARVVFIGDSITAGAGASDPAKGYAATAAGLLGFDDFVISAVGGSGFLSRYPADRGNNFSERMEDAVDAFAKRPSAIVVAGGINDCSVAPGGPYTAEQVGSAAGEYLRDLRAAVPETPIFVLGPFTDFNNPGYSATSRNCRDAIFAEAAAIPLVYTIDVADWVTPGRAGSVFDGNENGPHPVDAGHTIYAERLVDAITEIVASWSM